MSSTATYISPIIVVFGLSSPLTEASIYTLAKTFDLLHAQSSLLYVRFFRAEGNTWSCFTTRVKSDIPYASLHCGIGHAFLPRPFNLGKYGLLYLLQVLTHTLRPTKFARTLLDRCGMYFSLQSSTRLTRIGVSFATRNVSPSRV